MFETRLTWFWMLLAALALVIVGRLVQIQVVQAEQYERLAERILTRPPDYMTAPRGTIFDRDGTPLLSDEPTSDVCIHYAVLTDREEVRTQYLRRVAVALRERGQYPAGTPLAAIIEQLHAELALLWPRLAELTGLPEAELHDRAADACARVDRVRAAVQRNSPEIAEIKEEGQLLPIVADLAGEQALPVRLELEGRPWLRVLPSTRRVAHDADSLVHLLGRLGAASPQRIADDPLRDDELRGLGTDDRCGISGVERLGETTLRGTRGKIVEGFDRRVVERIEPQPGRDVYLTIDRTLQKQCLALLKKAVDESAYPAGGSAVVIDVASREVLALVSYPTYGYGDFVPEYDRLRRDTRGLPLRFRAVSDAYPPGSICKVITTIGGLSEGVITEHTRFHCTGYLLPNHPDRFRCWIYNREPALTHDDYDDPAGQNAESAIRNSCNIFFFKVGGLLGPERLCSWFRRCGLGRTQGTGLIEEGTGIVPDAEWMQNVRGRAHAQADAWNFAIGQGEVTCTPLQAANVAATVASGHWAPVRLAYDNTGRALGDPIRPTDPLDERWMHVLRKGMWRVVNEPGGTANKSAPLDRKDYVLCGKTGSAQTVPRVLNSRYTFEWPDGRREEVVAIDEDDARARFGADQPKLVGEHAHERFPSWQPDEKLPSHAWFIGFTQPAATPQGAIPTGHVYAISVIIEFGGGGGSVGGPVVKQIAEYLLARDLDAKKEAK